jgi:uncharacterized RDD family membrane protein YckC
MKITHIRRLLAAFLVLMLAVLIFAKQPKVIGLSAQSIDGGYRFSGGTHPLALAFAALMMTAYLLLINAKQPETGNPVSGIFLRFVAFWLDFFIALAIIAPVLGVIPTVAEWRRTGVFQWTFERTVSARGDALQASLLGSAMVGALLVYYAIPLFRSRPSPGACIVGYRIVPDDGTTISFKWAILRSALGFVAVCAAFVAPFIGRDRQQGKFWRDKVFSTRAISLN